MHHTNTLIDQSLRDRKSVSHPEHTTLVRMADARALRAAADALDALDAGESSSKVELPSNAILEPTLEQLAVECRLLGIKPPQEIPKEGWLSPVFMTAKPEDLFSMFGGPVVLLEVRPRTKKPVRNGWQALTIEDMIPRYLAGLNSGCNLGVSLGAASRNLITIDFDTEEHWQQILALNPCFANTLLSHGNRGGNVWLYIEGDLPASCDIKDRDGNKVAEFRSTGRQTIIRGIHESGKHYASNGHTPLSMRIEEIVWPDDFVLPWIASATSEAEIDPLEAQLIAQCGPPFVLLKRRGVQINHAYFVRRFCLEHRVLFETTDGAFYLYEESSGVWKYVDAGVIKELIRADWLRIATENGGNVLSVLGTDTLLNQLTRGVRSYAGKAGAFKRLQRGLLHVGNHILKI